MTQKSRWRAVVVAAALLVPTLVTVPLPAAASEGAEAIHAYRATPGDVASEKFTLKANGVDVFVTKYANRSNNRMAVARFASDDATPTLAITADAPITSWKIHPDVHYPAGAVTVSGNTLTFDMSEAMRYVIAGGPRGHPRLRRAERRRRHGLRHRHDRRDRPDHADRRGDRRAVLERVEGHPRLPRRLVPVRRAGSAEPHQAGPHLRR